MSTASSSRTAQSCARLAAVQALYALAVEEDLNAAALAEAFVTGDIGGRTMVDDPDTEEEFEVILADMDPVLFRKLVKTATDRAADIAEMIRGSLSDKWSEARLERTARAILQTGLAELLMEDQTPAQVIISEYVDIAKSFYPGPESGMVNAVLDRVARLLRTGDFETPAGG